MPEQPSLLHIPEQPAPERIAPPVDPVPPANKYVPIDRRQTFFTSVDLQD